MKRILLILTCSIVAAVAVDAFARGGGGHGGGGHFGGGGGGGHGFGGYSGGHGFSGGYGGGHSPSFGNYGGFSRGAGSFSRPSYTGGSNFNRSNFGGNSFNRGAFNGANVGNRTNFNAGNRVGGFDRTNIANNNFGVGNRANINNNWNRNGNINNWNNNRAGWNNNINNWANRGNRPWSHPYYNHYNNWHNGWHHGYWNYWGGGYYPWAWFGLGALGGYGWGSYGGYGSGYGYSNPYYVAADNGSYCPDYSQPIPPPSDAAVDSPPPTGIVNGGPTPDDGTQTDPKIAAAMAVFNEGRKLFKSGDYEGAIQKDDVALKDLPSDAALHEFRALCLFAQGKYQEAAAGVYAVLAAGPGWDWNTVKSLYPDTATYTKQLRALEEYKKANPKAPDASFLLAYQYLVLGYPDQAAGELKQVVKLQPDDKLSAALLQALEQRNQPQQQQPAPAQGM